MKARKEVLQESYNNTWCHDELGIQCSYASLCNVSLKTPPLYLHLLFAYFQVCMANDIDNVPPRVQHYL